METQPAPQGAPQPHTPVQPKTAGVAIASLVCGILAFCIPLLPGLAGIILGIVAIRKINASHGGLGGKGLAIGGLASSGVATLITGLLLPAMLLPALARAKSKANRVKCVYNCSQQCKAMLGFAQDNGERMPWQFTPSAVRRHVAENARQGDNYGSQISPGLNEVHAHPYTLETAGVWGLLAVKRELMTAKILHSPCDPTRNRQNELVQENWAQYDTKANGVSAELGGGTSYTLIRGANTMRPSSVLGVTRNLSDNRLDNSRWLGSDSDNGNGRTMAGLTYSQGQMVLMDGSARQSNNADIGGGGQITRAARSSMGGVARGQTSLHILRGAGLD